MGVFQSSESIRQSVHSPAKGGDPVPHCESGVLEAGILLHLVALNSYGQVAVKQCRYWIA